MRELRSSFGAVWKTDRRHLGQKEVSGQLNKVIRVLLDQRLIEYTLPDKPNSRLQKYRLTLAGERALKERLGG